MQVNSIKTHKITIKDRDIFEILDKYISLLHEKSVVAITSKIISICEGRVVALEKADREALVEKEAEYFLPASENQYGFNITVKHNMLIASAGIDESNGNGYFVLWPSDPQLWVNKIREYLSQKHKVKHIGVIITDSKTTPLRWGVTGAAISHSGFKALNNYMQKPDIFGRPLHVTKANIMDGLAAAAVVVMGEGIEQTPLAVLEDLPFVHFQDRNPTQEELEMLRISLEDDIYAGILKKAKWRKGKTPK
ncbi:MAG: coenzyme F420-0:L-glutamate ligase [Candidatus Levybacteria bacterium]|nr:coenzyme F420-0:L-glutamate ligase [Candidatus Levybacteria bacterium]